MDQKTLKQFESLLNKALVNVATKDDLKALKDELSNAIAEEIKDSEGFIVKSVTKYAASKTIVEDLEKRVTKLERKVKIN